MKVRWMRIAGSLLLVWWIPAVVGLTAATWWDQLPGEIPTKWGPEGPTEFAPLWALVALVVVGCVIASVVATTSIVGSPSFRTIWISAGIAGMFAGIWIFVATASLNQEGLSDPSPWALTTPLLVAYGLFPAVVSPPAHVLPAADASETEVPAVKLDGDRTVASVASAHSPVLLAGGIASMLGAAGFLFGGWVNGVASISWILPASTLLVMGLLLLTFASIRTVVNRTGVRVRSALFGIPIRSIPIDEIEQAETSNIRASRWGGLGYRIGADGTAVVVNSGPALKLDLTGGRAFLVSHPRNAEAARTVDLFLHSTRNR